MNKNTPAAATAPPISLPCRPASGTLLALAAANGGNLRAIAAALTELLQRYGAAELQAAIAEALDRNVPHHNAVRFALERRRQERGSRRPSPSICRPCEAKTPPSGPPASNSTTRSREAPMSDRDASLRAKPKP